MRTLLVLVLMLSACNPPKDQKTGSIAGQDATAKRKELPAALRTQLDSGNAAFHARKYDVALKHYRAAIAIKDDEPAPWFGVYMAQNAMGDTVAADSALKKAQKLAPGASILRK